MPKVVIKILFLIGFFTTWGAGAAEVEAVRLADRIRVSEAGPELVLNGAGVRTRFVFKVYVGALYLQRKMAAAAEVLNDTAPKRVAMHLLRELSSDQLLSALNDGLKNNHTPEQLAAFEQQIRQLEGIFGAVKAAKAGDAILLDYLPEHGTRITVNGDTKGIIPGFGFNQALLRVWLGASPADADLKKAMLGGS
ncbi:MAG: chalcone isomerase family protein [Burkholderiales bacterium]